MSQSAESPKRQRRLRRWEASAYLLDVHGQSYGPTTLAKLASTGGGPPMEYVGRIPTYPVDALDAWADAKVSRRVESAAEFRSLQAA